MRIWHPKVAAVLGAGTIGLLAGINPKVVSEGLGHSNIGITLDLYSHVLPNMQRHAAEAEANLLKRD